MNSGRDAQMRGERVRRGLTAVLICTCLSVAWWFASTTNDQVARLRLPSPNDVFIAAQQIASRGYAGETLLTHVVDSTRRVIQGFLIASLIGMLIGLAMGLYRRVDWFLNPIVQLLRPIPPLAWIPLAILWFGLGDTSKIFVAWLAVFTPTVINTYTGVRNVDRTLIAAARVHGARTLDVVMEVAVPSALPLIFTGLKLSLQVAWMAVVASELVGARSGLGYLMMAAARDLASPMIVVSMICVALLGLVSTQVLAMVERRVIRWR